MAGRVIWESSCFWVIFCTNFMFLFPTVFYSCFDSRVCVVGLFHSRFSTGKSMFSNPFSDLQLLSMCSLCDFCSFLFSILDCRIAFLICAGSDVNWSLEIVCFFTLLSRTNFPMLSWVELSSRFALYLGSDQLERIK